MINLKIYKLFKMKPFKETEQRCPNCSNLLSKNLEGKVEIKCKRCKSIIKLIR